MADLRLIGVLSCALLWTACGSDDGPPSGPMDGGGTTDAGAGGTDGAAEDGGGGAACTSDADCSDGNPCNGDETCSAGSCEDGAAPDDGTACDVDGDPTTTDYCVDALCAPSRCGDGVVDTDAGEACDDRNDVDGDGCDDCRLSCTMDGDCDDGEECNGSETCNAATNICSAGMVLADGTMCSGGSGVCTMGVCVPASCMDNADCDDSDPCNGPEACRVGMCELGTPLDCDDMDACTADSCDAAVMGGCVNTLVDADLDGAAPSSLGACGTDCDDTDPTVYGGAPEPCDGVDNDCDGAIDEDTASITWYADCDGDTYAAMMATSITSCAMPPVSMTGCPAGVGGWTTRAPSGDGLIDCNDANPTVNPAQTVFQSTAIPGAPMSIDFDYDCNGVEEMQTPSTLGGCELDRMSVMPRCVFRVGWMTRTAPQCGETAPYLGAFFGACRLVIASDGSRSCVARPINRTQRCR